MTTSDTITSPVEVTEIVGSLDIACEYSEFEFCPDGPAEWIAFMVCCPCGHALNNGHNLICTNCKDYVIATEDDAWECDACGEVYAPARTAYRRFDAIDRRSK